MSHSLWEIIDYDNYGIAMTRIFNWLVQDAQKIFRLLITADRTAVWQDLKNQALEKEVDGLIHATDQN